MSTFDCYPDSRCYITLNADMIRDLYKTERERKEREREREREREIIR